MAAMGRAAGWGGSSTSVALARWQRRAHSDGAVLPVQRSVRRALLPRATADATTVHECTSRGGAGAWLSEESGGDTESVRACDASRTSYEPFPRRPVRHLCCASIPPSALTRLEHRVTQNASEIASCAARVPRRSK